MSVYNKLPYYIQLVRPFTLIAPFVAGVLGTLAPVRNVGFSEIKVAIYAGVTLALLQASGQVINQYADSELDSYAKPYRPIPRGKVSREEALGIGLLLLIAGIARSFLISTTFGLIGLMLSFMSIYYSLPPFSPRRVNALLNAVWISIARGTLPLIAVWSIYGDISQAVPYIIVATLWVSAFQPTKDVSDIPFDEAFGIKTIPNTYGLKGYKYWCVAHMFIMGVAIVVLKLFSFTPLLIIGIVNVLTLDKELPIIENNVAWAGYYIGLSLIYVIMFASQHI